MLALLTVAVFRLVTLNVSRHYLEVLYVRVWTLKTVPWQLPQSLCNGEPAYVWIKQVIVRWINWKQVGVLLSFLSCHSCCFVVLLPKHCNICSILLAFLRSAGATPRLNQTGASIFSRWEHVWHLLCHLLSCWALHVKEQVRTMTGPDSPDIYQSSYGKTDCDYKLFTQTNYIRAGCGNK